MNTVTLTYLGLAALAAVEASPVGYLIPGTLGVIAAGGLVQAGKLNGPAALLAVWLGVLVGDVVSYWLARKFGDVLRRWRTVADALTRAEGRLKRHPVAFIFFSHLSPFLKNVVAPAAGLTGISWTSFLTLEVGAAAVDAIWFLSVGYVVSGTIGNVIQMPVAARVVGAVAILGIVIFLIGRGRTCALPRTAPSTLLKAKRGFGFILRVLLLLGPWEFAGRLAKRVGAYDRPDYRAALVRAIDVALPGDMIFVGRNIAAPWGDWSHVGMIVKTPAGKAVLHAYENDVRLTGAQAYPMCGKVAIARLNCTREKREAMVAAAWKLLGAKFKLGSRKPGSDAPAALNCVGLLESAAAQAGITLNDIPVGGVVTPDDVFDGGNARIVFVWRDGIDRDEAPATSPNAPSANALLSPASSATPAPPKSDESTAANHAATTMVRSEIFLGLSRQDGQPIADAQVSAFVETEVVSRFPAGVTQVAASGSYSSRVAGVIHERSRVLTILHPDDLASRTKIHELAVLYRLRFHQEAVLVSMSPALVFMT